MEADIIDFMPYLEGQKMGLPVEVVKQLLDADKAEKARMQKIHPVDFRII